MLGWSIRCRHGCGLIYDAILFYQEDSVILFIFTVLFVFIHYYFHLFRLSFYLVIHFSILVYLIYIHCCVDVFYL